MFRDTYHPHNDVSNLIFKLFLSFFPSLFMVLIRRWTSWACNEHCAERPKKNDARLFDLRFIQPCSREKSEMEFSWGYLNDERWHNPYIYLALILCSYEWNRSLYMADGWVTMAYIWTGKKLRKYGLPFIHLCMWYNVLSREDFSFLLFCLAICNEDGTKKGCIML